MIPKNLTVPALAMLVVAGAASVGGCENQGGTRTFASIGTAGTGGIYYPLGGTLARMLSESLPGVSFTAEVTGGSVENLNRVASGEIDLGMAIGTTLAKAREGAESERFGAVRVVAPLYPNVAHLLAGASSRVSALEDVAGLRVSVGAAGSGTEQMARDLLAAHGLSLDDVEPQYLSFTESASALRDGAIDAAIFSVGYPAAAVLEATTTGGVRLLALRDPGLSRLLSDFPYYELAVLPSASYPGVDGDLATVAVMNWIIAREDLDGAFVRAVLDALRDRRHELIQVSDIASQIDLGALTRAPLPLHPAAAAWLSEGAAPQ